MLFSENNSYPKSLVDFCIKKYLDKVFIKKEVVLTASKKELICVLPFIEKSHCNWETTLQLYRVDKIDPEPVVLWNIYLLRRGEWNLGFFMIFNIIISHIFSENFIEISQVVQKLWRISLSILDIFINFHQFSGFFLYFFYISLLQRN